MNSGENDTIIVQSCACARLRCRRAAEELGGDFMRSIKQWLKREAGQSVVLVALSIAMLCGVAALVVDVGMVFSCSYQKS